MTTGGEPSGSRARRGHARLPRRGARVPARARARARRCRRWTPPRASRRTASGSTRSPTRGCRWCRGRREFGGRDASLDAVGGVRGGVLRRRRAAAGEPERDLPARADAVRARHAGAARAHPAADGARRRDLGAGVVRARGRQRPGRHPRQRAVRDRRRLAAVRAEDLVDPGDLRRPRLRAVPHRPGRRAASRADLLPVRPARRRRHRARHPAAGRRAGLRRDLPRRRVRPGRGRARRRRRRLEGRDVDRVATSAGCRCAPPAGSSPPRTGWSSWPRGCDRHRADRPGRRRVDRRARLRAAHLGHRHPAGRRRRARRRVERRQAVLVAAGRRAARDRARPARRATASCAGDWMAGYLFSLAGPIYAGTNEIQRNVVAERLLGLPR